MSNLKEKINLCVDFDGTIASEPIGIFPLCGEIREKADYYLQKLFNDEAFIVTIWTCRTGTAEQYCKEFLKKYNMDHHYFNDHSAESILKYGTSEGKKVAGVYIDNNSLEWTLNGTPSWEEIYNMVQKLKQDVIPQHQK